MERAEAGHSSKSKRRSGEKVMIMKDIKKDERYKAVEEMFSGKAKRRSGHGSGSAAAEYRYWRGLINTTVRNACRTT